jgi:hypothetical protein
MNYVVVAVISLIVGAVVGVTFSGKIHAAILSLELTVETRLRAIEAAVKAKL